MSALSEYATLAFRNPRFLAFGFFMCFTSSAGQTYFIGIFGPEIRETFDISHTEWGLVYMIGTLASAFVLPWSGQLLDRVDLRFYTAAVIFGLIIAALSTAAASSLVMLTVSIFLLRQFGQGLTSHTSVTSMARYMGVNRGKAIAIASTGFSVGEATLPLLAVIGIAALGWRNAYLATAGVLVFLLILNVFLLRGHHQRHSAYLKQHVFEGASQTSNSISRKTMVRELRFYLILPAVLAPNFIATALFFHHLNLAAEKGWSDIWVTGNYWVYALFSVLASLIAGPLIDRYSAARIIPYYLTPLIIALWVLIPAQQSFWFIPYMVLLGLNTGVYFTAISALWAELYGTQYLGSIKSLVGAIGVFASALGPISVGAMLDAGLGFAYVNMALSLLCVVSTVLLIIGLKQFRR